MKITINPQVVKVTAQPPGVKAQASAAGEDVIITPQALAVSALSSALGVNIQNPIGRDIIQGMDYESGSWQPAEDIRTATIPFSNQHNNPPYLFLMYSNDRVMISRSYYGKLFINYLLFFGAALRNAPTLPAQYGMIVQWYTPNSATVITQGIQSLTSEDALATHATNEHIVVGFTDASNTYLRRRKIYNWVAAFMPEE